MSLSDREWDDLKLLLDKAVYKFLGFSEPSLVTAALNCIDKGYDEGKTADKLLAILDEKQAPEFAETLFTVWDDYKTSSKTHRSKKRKDEKEPDEILETKKKRKFDENVAIPVVPEGPSPGQLTADKIKEMMANAQKMIQERKAQLQVGIPTIPDKPAQSPQVNRYRNDSQEKAKRANDLHAQIQARLQGLAGMAAPNSTSPQAGKTVQAPLAKPTPLILDEEGRTIDVKTGQAVTLTHHAPTLKANIRAKRREHFKGLIDSAPEEISSGKYFDPRVSAKGAQRQKRGFRFYDQGKFEQMGSRLRTKAQLERLQSEISQAAKKTGIASAAKLATITPKKELVDGEIPDIEWWDAFIVNTEAYEAISDDTELKQRLEGITHLVEHPSQMQPPAQPKTEPAIPVILTAKERRKIRRQNRQERDKEESEKVRLGLKAPPEPKVRMANLMRVLGTEAVQDPTKVEAHVRAQMAKRQKQHEETNAARKLTAEQRTDKKIKKIKEDTSLGVHVALYRIKDLSNASIKFKIEKNAQQLFMTGLVVLFKDCNIVVVEGGPKQQRKYKKLLLNRIKWSEDKPKRSKNTEGGRDGEEGDNSNKCSLVWEGTRMARSFGDVKFKICPTEAFAREQFRKHAVEEYWDLAFGGAVMETASEDV